MSFVCHPVSADVIRIKRSKIGSRKDEVVARASCVDIYRHASSGASHVCERVSVVTQHSRGERARTDFRDEAITHKPVAIQARSLKSGAVCNIAGGGEDDCPRTKLAGAAASGARCWTQGE